MKKVISILILLLFVPALCFGQGRIFTRKTKLADFSAKTTKIVLSGDTFMDIALKEEVMSRWRISPFEFCSPDEFESLRKDSSFYFLYLSEDGSGIASLSLIKGGNDESFKSMDGSFDVVEIPFAPVQMSTGREYVFLPALIDIVQIYIEESIMSETKSYLGLSSYNGRLPQVRRKKIYIARDDLSSSIPGRDTLETLAPGIEVVDDYTLDSLFTAGSKDALIAFCISSAEPARKAKSYLFVVSADSHELYYYKFRPYRKEESHGFSSSDIRGIKSEHRYKD